MAAIMQNRNDVVIIFGGQVPENRSNIESELVKRAGWTYRSVRLVVDRVALQELWRQGTQGTHATHATQSSLAHAEALVDALSWSCPAAPADPGK